MKAPPVVHCLQPFNAFSVPKLSDACPKLLPDRWRELMILQIGINHTKRISNSDDQIFDNSSAVPDTSQNMENQEPIKKNGNQSSNLPEVLSDFNRCCPLTQSSLVQAVFVGHEEDAKDDSPKYSQPLPSLSTNEVIFSSILL